MRRLVHLTLRAHTSAGDDTDQSADARNAFDVASARQSALAQQILDAVPAVQSAAIGFGRDERSFWRFSHLQQGALGDRECVKPRQISEEEAFNNHIYMGETQDESDAEEDED